MKQRGAGPEKQTKCLSLVPLKVGGIRHLPGWMDGWMHRGSTDHRSVRCEGRNDESINPCHPAIFSQRCFVHGSICAVRPSMQISASVCQSIR